MEKTEATKGRRPDFGDSPPTSWQEVVGLLRWGIIVATARSDLRVPVDRGFREGVARSLSDPEWASLLERLRQSRRTYVTRLVSVRVADLAQSMVAWVDLEPAARADQTATLERVLAEPRRDFPSRPKPQRDELSHYAVMLARCLEVPLPRTNILAAANVLLSPKSDKTARVRLVAAKLVERMSLLSDRAIARIARQLTRSPEPHQAPVSFEAAAAAQQGLFFEGLAQEEALLLAAMAPENGLSSPRDPSDWLVGPAPDPANSSGR
ncbi:MAG: hypothetical protein IPJ34_13490 [Myxococcales bacterium]|nr:hypothetical protein [Myxococcales bacterium]